MVQNDGGGVLTRYGKILACSVFHTTTLLSCSSSLDEAVLDDASYLRAFLNNVCSPVCVLLSCFASTCCAYFAPACYSLLWFPSLPETPPLIKKKGRNQAIAEAE
jgi:hypothetical protein